MDYILAYSKSSRRVRELENKLAYTVSKYEKEIAGLKKRDTSPSHKIYVQNGAIRESASGVLYGLQCNALGGIEQV